MYTHQKLNWITVKRLIIITFLGFGITACNGGGSSGSSSGTTSMVTTSSNVDFSDQAQLVTPTVAATTSSCLIVSSSSITQNTPYWVSGSFVVKNNCSTSAVVNGLQISMLASTASLTASSFSFNSVSGFSYPAPVYWAPTTLIAANSTIVNNKTSLLLTVSTDSSGVMTSNSTATFSYGYNPNGQSVGNLSFSIGSSPVPPTPTPTPTPESSSCPGITPWSATTTYSTAGYLVVYNGIEYKNNWWTLGDNPATKSGPSGSGQPWTSVGSCTTPSPTQGAIALTIDTTILKSICSGSTVCSIPLTLSGQNGAFESIVSTVNNSNAGSIIKVNVTGLNIGTYNLTVVNSSLPSQVTFSASPITLTSNTTPVIATASFAVTPIATGAVNYTLIKPSDITLSNNNINVNLVNSNNASVGSNNSIFGQSTSFTNINSGTYNLTTYGLADAKTGIYYAPLKQAVTITAGSTTNAGNINFTKVTTNIIPIILTITGLQGSDVATITITDSSNYTFNVLSNGNGSITLNMLNNDNIVLNVSVPTKYKALNPISTTVVNGSVVNLNITQLPLPSGQIVGYYETWLATATWDAATYSLAKIPAYVNTIPLAFAKPDATYTSGSFVGTGLDFTPSFSLVESSIAIAHSKGQKVLLSVGGATYQNFGTATNSKMNVPALIGLVRDLHLDGIDLDFEPSGNGCSNLNATSLSCPTDQQLINIITSLRSGLDTLKPGLILSAAVWSIGAYGTPSYPTTTYGPVGVNSAIWVNPLKQVGNKLDEIFLMSYDAGIYTPTGSTCAAGQFCYDPSAALSAYKAIYSGPIYQGMEVPPEAWGGNVLAPANAVTLATTAANLGASGVMIWALEVQGNGYTSNSFLQPICLLYNPGANSLCSQMIPLN
ncbi:MAG: hypothetical protein KBD37_04635 [Burkholderiales bacterium]|nr:hypothetical protein [Burkholderiales bacterium]